jgi:transcriptional regulator of arginine metabolism
MSERTVKADRQRLIRELVTREAIGSQYELAARLARAGYPVTQATVSRDIAELGLIKMPVTDGHAYVIASELGRGGGDAPNGLRDPRGGAAEGDPRDERLRRLLSDLPATIGRSGLILVLRSAPGMANALGQAIDESSMQDQEGTLAGDDTLLVLFADEARLDRWLTWFSGVAARAGIPSSERFSPSLSETLAPRILTEVIR